MTRHRQPASNMAAQRQELHTLPEARSRHRSETRRRSRACRTADEGNRVFLTVKAFVLQSALFISSQQSPQHQQTLLKILQLLEFQGERNLQNLCETQILNLSYCLINSALNETHEVICFLVKRFVTAPAGLHI